MVQEMRDFWMNTLVVEENMQFFEGHIRLIKQHVLWLVPGLFSIVSHTVVGIFASMKLCNFGIHKDSQGRPPKICQQNYCERNCVWLVFPQNRPWFTIIDPQTCESEQSNFWRVPMSAPNFDPCRHMRCQCLSPWKPSWWVAHGHPVAHLYYLVPGQAACGIWTVEADGDPNGINIPHSLPSPFIFVCVWLCTFI